MKFLGIALLLIPVSVSEFVPERLIFEPVVRERHLKPDFDNLIKAAVDKHLPGYDWRLFKSQLWNESKLVPTAVSPVGAQGIAQFMPTTWAEWAPKAGYPDKPATDPEASIMTGAMYMAYLIGKWSAKRPEADRHCLAMASYNAGFGNLLKAQKAAGNPHLYADIIQALPKVTGDNSKETITYVRRIMNDCAKLITGEIT